MIRFIADVIKALLNKYDYIINQFLLYLFSSKCLYIFFKEKTLHLKLFFFIKFLIYIIDLSLKCHYTASVMFSQMFYVSEAKLFQMSTRVISFLVKPLNHLDYIFDTIYKNRRT